jgi:hypothetical protein
MDDVAATQIPQLLAAVSQAWATWCNVTGGRSATQAQEEHDVKPSLHR